MIRSSFLLTAALAVAAVGCSNRNPILSGTITLDGKPLESGTVQTIPMAGDGQTAATAIGTDGRYKVSVSPTKLRLVVNSMRKVGERKSDVSTDGSAQNVFEEVVPAPYSDMFKSELIVTIEPGTDKEFNIDMKSEPKKK